MGTPVSFRHGTVEGYTKHKCNCVRCDDAYRSANGLPPTNPIAESVKVPAVPDLDIISFLHGGRFNEITIDLINGEWAATIKAHGDKYVGFGVGADYALATAIRRYQDSDPQTGPLTITYNQSTYETSQGNGLDHDNTVGLEKIWQDSDSTDAS